MADVSNCKKNKSIINKMMKKTIENTTFIMNFFIRNKILSFFVLSFLSANDTSPPNLSIIGSPVFLTNPEVIESIVTHPRTTRLYIKFARFVINIRQKRRWKY